MSHYGYVDESEQWHCDVAHYRWDGNAQNPAVMLVYSHVFMSKNSFIVQNYE